MTRAPDEPAQQHAASGGAPVVSISRKGPVAVLRFDRGGQANALTFELMEQLVAAARSFEADRETAVVILTGADRIFSGGMDLKADVWDTLPSLDLEARRDYARARRDCLPKTRSRPQDRSRSTPSITSAAGSGSASPRSRRHSTRASSRSAASWVGCSVATRRPRPGATASRCWAAPRPPADAPSSRCRTPTAARSRAVPPIASHRCCWPS